MACSDVNLQTKKNSPLNTIPTYDQDGLGACYAYASSVLIDYKRMKDGYGGEGNLTHPIWLAMLYSKNRDEINGGHISSTINKSIADGICKQSIVNKKLKDFITSESR